MEKFPKKWVRPKLSEYKGVVGSQYHIRKFIRNMEDLIDRRDLWCQMFCRSLEEDAIGWFKELSNRSIKSFEDYKRKFCEAFSHLICRKIDNGALLNIKQSLEILEII